ncbi:nicotinamidase-like isoform X2 [Littorina saxatilis]
MLVLLTITAALAGTQTVRGHQAALLIIDVQDCFLPRGSLAVSDGDQVIPVINKLREDFKDAFSLVVLSQDWHCPDHVSFASQHPGFNPYSVVNLTYNADGALCHGASVPSNFPYAVDCSNQPGSKLRVVQQTLWPDHCIRNVTSGGTSAEFSPLLTMKDSDVVVRKGYLCGVDSYSAFFDNGGFRQTELNGILKEHNIDLVVVTGLALDYCVYYTSKDAHALGYKVLTVTDAARGVAPGSTEAALEDMKNIGIELITAADLEGALQDPSKGANPGSFSFYLFVALGAVLTAFLVFKS